MNTSLMEKEHNNAAFDDMNSLFIEEEPPNNATFDDLDSTLVENDNLNKDLVFETQNQIIGTNISKDEFVLKEEPVEDDLVSKC